MEDVVSELVDLGQQLKNSGLTSGWLLLIGLLFFITLIAAFRELSAWYFKINHIQTQLNELNANIQRLERRLHGAEATEKGLEGLLQNKVTLTSVESQQRFTLNH